MAISQFTVGENGKPTITADRSERKDYGVNFAPFLADGDSLAEILSVTPQGVTVEEPAPFITGANAMAWIRFPAAAGTYSATFTVRTAGGREEVETIYFKVK